jgi:Leucine-rich repeat (LRR) protein
MIAASLTSIAPPQRRVLKKRPQTMRRPPDPQNSKTLMMAGGGVAAAIVVVLAIFLSGPASPPKETTTTPQPGPKTMVQAPEPARGGFDVATWEKSLADLPPEARVKAVHARLKTLNAGYDSSQAEHHIAHGRITRLRLASPALKDVSPLRALTDLRELELPSTGVSDLSPLRNSKLTLLVLDGSKIADLRPLRDMKELAILSLASTPVRDLSPLEGLDLARLTVTACPSADLSGLRRVKLRELHCDFDPKRDTETLKSMPSLEQINGVPVEEFWRKSRPTEPVAVPVPAPMDALGVALARLKELNPDWEGRETHAMENGTVVELVIVALGITDIAPLAPLKSLRKLDVSGYWSRSENREYRSRLSDLSPLRGLKLKEFMAHHTEVRDLGPLEGMPLEYLELTSTPLQSLAPLRGMRLKYLDVAFCDVRNIAPVAGMPLVELRMDHNEITDFSPLRGLPLTILNAALDPVRHHALVESIKTLVRVNGAPASEFLQAATPPPPPPDAAQWKTALDLIPHIDPARDTVVGPWRKENGKIYCDGGENAVLRIGYEPPAEYDFRIVFIRSQAHCGTAQFLVTDSRGFFWDMGGYGGSHSGFATVSGKGSGDNPTRFAFVPVNGTRYVSIVQVRKDRITAFVDGRKLSEWVPAMGEINTDPGWCVDVPGLIGLGNCESQTTFESVQIREVTGKGRFRNTALTTPPDPSFLKAVAALAPGDQVRRVIEKLKELNPLCDPGTMKYKIENEHVTEFSAGTARLFDAWPVKALPALKKLDLGDERGAGMLSDIGFLKGVKLVELGLSGTRVSDLSPLQGMPLTRLSISGTPVKDLAVLKSMPLQKIDCDRIPADLAVLKSIRTLKTVNDVPVGDPLKAPKDGNWTPLFDGRSTDCLRRGDGWKVVRGAIQNDPTVVNSAQTSFEFENGDLRIRFECRGVDALSFRARQNPQGASGLFFDGATVRSLEGKPHELLFTCRGDTVTVTLDGKPMPLTESTAARNGCLQFNATNGVLRVTSIDFRAAN